MLSVPAHALFSSLWGLALGWHKKRKTLKSSLLVVVGLLGSMVLHGLFNYLTSENLFGGLLFLSLMAIAWRGVFLLTRRAVKPNTPTDVKAAE